jgi:hypothetical protein
MWPIETGAHFDWSIDFILLKNRMQPVYVIGLILLFVFQSTYFFHRISVLNTNYNEHRLEMTKVAREFVLHHRSLEIRVHEFETRVDVDTRHFHDGLKEELDQQTNNLKDLEKRLLEKISSLSQQSTTLNPSEPEVEAPVPQYNFVQIDVPPAAKESFEFASKRLIDNLYKLQYPADCTNAKLLVCEIPNGCGFGCQMHKVAYCAYAAYGLGRTLIIMDKTWQYMQRNDLPNCQWEKSGVRPIGFNWGCLLAPISKCKISDSDFAGSRDFDGISSPSNEARVIRYDNYTPQKYEKIFTVEAGFLYAYYVPKELEPEIKKFHSDPPVWFLGQIMNFILRPNEVVKAYIQKMKSDLGFNHLIVGMHVRRTDKIGYESVLVPLEKYMQPVKAFFAARLTPGKKKLVYVSTDDSKAIDELRSSNPDYKFISQPGISAAPLTIERRYSSSELMRLIIDIHLLVECDMFVGTFSSQISRIVYEMMQVKHVDLPKEKLVISMDGGWFSGAGIQTGLYKDLLKKLVPK